MSTSEGYPVDDFLLFDIRLLFPAFARHTLVIAKLVQCIPSTLPPLTLAVLDVALYNVLNRSLEIPSRSTRVNQIAWALTRSLWRQGPVSLEQIRSHTSTSCEQDVLGPHPWHP